MAISYNDITLHMELGAGYSVELNRSIPATIWIDFLSKNLTEINDDLIPSSITNLWDYLFEGNTNLATVSLNNVTEIGSYTFNGCGIETLNMPSLVTAGSRSFGANPLTEVYLPALEYVDSQMFYNCDLLQKAEFDSIYRSGLLAFYGCTNLDTLVLRNDVSIVELASAECLEGTKIESGEGYIYVPSNFLREYRGYGAWSNFVSQLRAVEELEVD